MQRHNTNKRFGFAHMTALTIVSKQSTKESLSTSWSAHSSTTLLSMRIVSESSSMCPGDRPTPVGYKSLPHSVVRICLRRRGAPLSILCLPSNCFLPGKAHQIGLQKTVTKTQLLLCRVEKLQRCRGLAATKSRAGDLARDPDNLDGCLRGFSRVGVSETLWLFLAASRRPAPCVRHDARLCLLAGRRRGNAASHTRQMASEQDRYPDIDVKHTDGKHKKELRQVWKHPCSYL